MALFVLAMGGQAWGLGVGIQAGANIADISVSTPAASNTSTRFMGGGFLEIPLLDWLYLQPEFMYVGKGTNNGLVSSDWFSVPVLMKIKIPTGTTFSPLVFAGPELGLKLAGVNTNTFDFGADFGGGFELEIVPQVALFATGRYALGLINILNNTGAGLSPGLTWQSRGIYLLGGASVTF